RSLFDHLVGLREKTCRNVNADNPRRRQVEDQLELGRLDDGHVGWLLTLEDAASIDADLAVAFQIARSIAHEAAGIDEFARAIDRRKRMTRRKRRNDNDAIEE